MENMKFNDFLDTLKPIEWYSVVITLENGEEMKVEHIEGKLWSLKVVQNFLDDNNQTSEKFDLTQFCEYYEEWKNDPDWHHTTINFLNRYNEIWWTICKAHS